MSPSLRQLAPPPVSVVAAIPQSTQWVAGGGHFYVGDVETGKASIYDGYAWLKGVVALDATTLAMTNGSTVVAVRFPELEILRRIELPPVPDTWRYLFAGTKDLYALVTGSRLSVFGETEKSVLADNAAWGSPDAFTAVEVLPRSKGIVVARGDGRLEVRDAETLEVRAVHRPLTQDAGCICALNDDIVAVTDGDRTTALVSLSSGTVERLDYQDVVIGLHPRADGSLALACPRRALVYAGNKRVHDVDFAGQVPGAVMVKQSAMIGEMLLFADQIRGLVSLPLSLQ